MSLYFCDGCTETIPAQKARISCRECQNYDLCANCAILGTVTGAHLSSHQTAVHRTSGFANMPPPPAGQPISGAAGVPSAVAATAPAQRGQPTSSWTQFFNGQTWQHTDSFSRLVAAIFERLIGGTGYMTPEAHSALLDLLGTPLHENACMLS
ncbi:hypothetical protein F5144DRAFT_2299 [Chaetomium tenue]|uniref:Uncharacterized protein n=1 Tax=Chaetomium tenue TaxID=1854479 RepID=A0ACB7PJ90_9PEZI|nr:hypothetical protein F5144DRAFT_2299 [Chaetomium globosum]